MNNYIPDTNRFKLAGPPQWWLAKLWDFDNSLVVVPSRQDCVYRLAQRRKLILSDRIVQEALFNQSDTKMLASYSLVPVTTIIATANWSNPLMFETLRNRAPWRMGGADKVNAMLDEQDQKEVIDANAKIDEHSTYLAKDAWNLYLKKIGLRSQMWSPTTSNNTPKPTNRAPAIRIVAS